MEGAAVLLIDLHVLWHDLGCPTWHNSDTPHAQTERCLLPGHCSSVSMCICNAWHQRRIFGWYVLCLPPPAAIGCEIWGFQHFLEPYNGLRIILITDIHKWPRSSLLSDTLTAAVMGATFKQTSCGRCLIEPAVVHSFANACACIHSFCTVQVMGMQAGPPYHPGLLMILI